jgi:ABC-type branched-subunit amino acid transport system ATPase component
LEVKALTLRFGGLAAVSDVDLSVRAGEISAVIGPNGAGKTSLFNAITGIYEPTAGAVTIDGRDAREPLTRKTLAVFALTGLILGKLALLAAANVDGLWTAVVKAQPPLEFAIGQAVADAADYLAAEPRVETRLGKFLVVAHDGQQVLGSGKTRALAFAKLAAVKQELAAPTTPMLRQVADKAARARALRAVVFLLATAVGVAGSHAVWRRTRRTPTSVARRGVARTFQNIRLFPNMTVVENVLVAMDRHLGHRVPWTHPTRRHDLLWTLAPFGAVLGLVASLRVAGAESGLPLAFLSVFGLGGAAWLVRVGRRGSFSAAALVTESLGHTEARELLRFVGLDAHANRLAKELPYGEQRRLEIARALATKPKLLLLDEPAAGMNPSETVALMALIRSIRDRGVTVLLIEHHMRVVMGISDRITVLVHGKRIAEGTPEEIRNNPAVIEAYLGAEEQH